MPPVRRMAAAALPAADSGSVACTPVGSVRTGGGPGCRPGAFGARSEGTGGFHESQIKIGILFDLCKFKEKMLADCYRKCRFFIFFCLNGCFGCFFGRVSGVMPLCGGCRSGCLGVRTQGQTLVGMRRGIRCRWGERRRREVGCEEGMFGRVAAGFGRPMRCVGASGSFGMSRCPGASEARDAACRDVGMSGCGGPGWSVSVRQGSNL